MWREVLRVLKPGAHLLAFGGTRTYHRMACAIEDAGFDIRDCILWLYASGFPKSLDVSKAIDASNGDERPVVGVRTDGAWAPDAPHALNTSPGTYHATSAASAASAAWSGWGTGLKPACEPIVVARKPLIGTVAVNVLAHGTGGLNIDGCRVRWANEEDQAAAAAAAAQRLLREPQHGHGIGDMGIHGAHQTGSLAPYLATMGAGRWPANVIHDGSPEVLEAFARFGERASGASVGDGGRIFGAGGGPTHAGYPGDNGGSAARFFFSAKASRAEREIGCEGLRAATREDVTGRAAGSAGQKHARSGMTRAGVRNVHPTVKPLALLRYLCRLVTPPGGTVLDPFAGSGTCGMAALLEGFGYVGMELLPEHVRIAQARIGHVDGYGWTEDASTEDADRQRQLALFR
jgi:site-specific DNA-methyltransferase (adenine-specific)